MHSLNAFLSFSILRGSLSESKTILFLFDQKGFMMVSKDNLKEDCDVFEVAIEIGAEDVQEELNSEEAEEDKVCFVCEPKVGNKSKYILSSFIYIHAVH